ncbi:MAG: hypothetical protein MK101_06050, partial [Phycisphaerales bacterium]|nr:hypothetical protein [Phycisphaerales bacterium]
VAAVTTLPNPDAMSFALSEASAEGENPWMARHEGMQAARKPLQDRVTRARRELVALGGDSSPRPVRDIDHANIGEFGDIEASIVAIEGDLGDTESAVISSSFAISGDAAMSLGGHFGGVHGYTPLPHTLRTRLVRDLELDAAGQATLDALIADHAQSLQDSRRQNTDEANEPAGVHRVFISVSNNKEGIEATTAADDAFFSQVALLGDAQAIEPHQQARQRSLQMSGGGMFTIGMTSGQVYRADPTEALEQAGIDDHLVTEALRSMGDWHASATALAETYNKANRAHDEIMHAQMQSAFEDAEGGGGVANISFDLTGGSGLDEAMATAEKAKRALAQANDRGFELAKASLPEMAAQALERSWLQAAWPSIIGKGDPIQSSFDAVMALEDLTDSQRGAIAMLRVQHDGAWWAASKSIIDGQRDLPDISMMHQVDDHQQALDAWGALQRAQEETQLQKFRRREAVLKVLAQLRSELTPEQLQQVGGLPDPSESSRHQFIFQ